MSIEASDITKRYGSVEALVGASFSAHGGEVHALVGENGAGKSTLMGVLCGAVKPDSGDIRVSGEQVRLRSPDDAHRLGIQTVFQELTLFPWLTVAENLLLGNEPRTLFRLIRRGRLPEIAEQVLAAYTVSSIDPRALVADLPLAARQVLEIVRAISNQPRVLLLDEPTSSLSQSEVEWLFHLLGRLRATGTCVIFTSHRWREVNQIADRLTVFRNGRNVTTRRELHEREAVRLMTGRTASEMTYTTSSPPRAKSDALDVRNLSTPRLNHVSFRVGAGEIVGIGGLGGQGQRELLNALFGVEHATGQVLADGRPIRLRQPRDAMSAGIFLVPEDRKKEGLFLPMSVRENLTLPILSRLSRAGFVSLVSERNVVNDVIQKMSIKARGWNQPVGTLSGGNQQKTLLGRALLMRVQVLLLSDVTRGVDIATKQEVYRLVAELAAQGLAIVYYSSDTTELARLAHRVLVMAGGKIVAEIQGPGIDPESVVHASILGTASVVATSETDVSGKPSSQSRNEGS